MIILIKLFLNSKCDLIWTVKFVKQLFRIQIQKGGKVLLWNQVKSRIEACYSELVLGLTLKTTQRENGTVTKTSPQEMAVSSQPHTVIILGIINSFISNKSYFKLNLQHEKTV